MYFGCEDGLQQNNTIVRRLSALTRFTGTRSAIGLFQDIGFGGLHHRSLPISPDPFNSNYSIKAAAQSYVAGKTLMVVHSR
jgi:hypothetical protein